MTTLNASVAIKVSAQFENALDVGAAEYPLEYGPGWVFTNGNAANQASQVFTDTRTLAASASEDLDLNGTLLNAFGQTVNFTKVRALIIQAAAGNTNNVIVGGAAANQFASMFGAATHTLIIRPGGAVALIAPDTTGYTVTAATGDLLKIANSAAGSTVDYTITVIGA